MDRRFANDISPIDGLWPEWPGRLTLTYEKESENPEVAMLFWDRPHQFLGCAACGIVFPLEQKWIERLRAGGQLFCCRTCAAQLWLDKRKKDYPLERHFVCQKDYDKLWYRHQLQARLYALLAQAKARSALKGWQYDLVFPTLHKLWYEQYGRCGLSFESMLLRYTGFDQRDDLGPSLDRKFPDYGYLNPNIHLTRWGDNRMRRGRDMTAYRLEVQSGRYPSEETVREFKRLGY
jgi:hypothetical protein